jgi:small subunit ribosomal protein S16
VIVSWLLVIQADLHFLQASVSISRHMLMIRLQRTGRKHEPTFRVVLTDSKNGPKSGRYLKILGWYDTRIKNKVEQLEVEAIKDWMSKGAKLSVTLHNFLVSNKVITGKKINALPKKTVQKSEAPAEAATPAAAPAPAAEATPAAEAAPVAA